MEVSKKTFMILFMSLLSWVGFKDQGTPLKEGSKMPRVQVQDDMGHLFFMDEVSKQGWVLVYFYPKADTPGCTAQACSLRDHYEELTHLGVKVFGASKDKRPALEKFKLKYSLPFTLISDADVKLANTFGVPTWFGFTSRQAYLFREGVLVWRDLVGSTRTQADEVLRVIRERS